MAVETSGDEELNELQPPPGPGRVAGGTTRKPAKGVRVTKGFLKLHTNATQLGEISKDYRDDYAYPTAVELRVKGGHEAIDEDAPGYDEAPVLGKRYGSYGVLPPQAQSVLKDIKGGVPVTAHEKSFARATWGGLLGPMPLKVGNQATQSIDEQYGNVIEAIEAQLGTRTDSGVWQGRLTT